MHAARWSSNSKPLSRSSRRRLSPLAFGFRGPMQCLPGRAALEQARTGGDLTAVWLVTAHRPRTPPFRSESGHLIGPQRPVGELVERSAPGALDQVIVGDSAGIHAGPAATDLGAVTGSGFDHAIQMVVAVGHPLTGDGITHTYVSTKGDPMPITETTGTKVRVLGAVDSQGKFLEPNDKNVLAAAVMFAGDEDTFVKTFKQSSSGYFKIAKCPIYTESADNN